MLLTSDIRRAVQEKIDNMKNSLANGAATDYSDYQHAVGIIQGLEMAMDIAVDVVNIRIQSDDEE